MKTFFSKLRFRNIYMVFFSIVVLLAAFFSDPDNGFIQNMPMGAGFLATLLVLTKAVIYVTLLHISRKALFDYIDLEEFFNQAKTSPTGSGLALVAVTIAMVSISILIYATVL